MMGFAYALPITRAEGKGVAGLKVQAAWIDMSRANPNAIMGTMRD